MPSTDPGSPRPPGRVLYEALQAALAEPPTVDGGVAVVLASAGPPPAIALLSAADVHVDRGHARLAIHTASSAVKRLGGSCTLLVAGPSTHALRVAIDPATARHAGQLAVVEGPIRSIEPTAEPPWELVLSFRRASEDTSAAERFVSHWRNVKRWLRDDASGAAPEPPRTQRNRDQRRT